jgi:hypothetical protein
MVENYPPTRVVFDFFLGPFGITPYLIPAFQLKMDVEEKVEEVKETVKEKIVSIDGFFPIQTFFKRIKRIFKSPPAVEAPKLETDLATSGILPNADPAFFENDNAGRQVVKPKSIHPTQIRADDGRSFTFLFHTIKLFAEYTARLLEAVKFAQDHVTDAVQIKMHLIQDYENNHLFLIDNTSMASRNEETDARRAIAHLKKVGWSF